MIKYSVRSHIGPHQHEILDRLDLNSNKRGDRRSKADLHLLRRLAAAR